MMQFSFFVIHCKSTMRFACYEIAFTKLEGKWLLRFNNVNY